VNPTATEITVILKNEESTYRQKFLVYEAYTFQFDDPIINDCVNQAKMMFKGDPEEIKVKASLEVQ